MRNRRRLIATSLSLAVAAAALAGCGSDGGGEAAAVAGSTVSPITVGSKDFTENILIGEMLVQALENEGAEVKSQTNLGGTSVARDALVNDEVDVYPEYTGTAYTVFLKHDTAEAVPKGGDANEEAEKLFKVTSEEDLQKNKIKWVGRSPFNNTYGFAANGDLAKKEGGFDFDSMAAYLKANPDTKVCMETEFPDRPDGLVLFEKATGYKVPQSQIQILETGLIYTETSRRQVRLRRGVHHRRPDPGTQPRPRQGPGSDDPLQPLVHLPGRGLQEERQGVRRALPTPSSRTSIMEKMAELNAQVDVEGLSFQQVAEKYLEEIGVL